MKTTDRLRAYAVQRGHKVQAAAPRGATVAMLRTMCMERGVSVPSKAVKADLVAALDNHLSEPSEAILTARQKRRLRKKMGR